jgi:hypothetical protein
MARHEDERWLDLNFSEKGCHECAAIDAVGLSIIDRLIDEAYMLRDDHLIDGRRSGDAAVSNVPTTQSIPKGIHLANHIFGVGGLVASEYPFTN